jgi:integrase/recombinase XerD
MVTRGPSQVRVSGPLAPHVDGFRATLDARRFSPWSQMFYLHLLADVSRWLDRHGLDASGLTDTNVSAFRQDRRSRGRARFRGTAGLALLVSFLRDAGAAPPPASAEPGDEIGVLVAEFAGYLAGERGLRPQTIVLYSGAARRFLNSLPDGGDGILAGLTADAVRPFVIAESGRRGTGSLKNQVTAVRSLLRFLHLRGRIPDPVDDAVPAAAGWHRPPLTRRIRPGDVAAILASCDRDTHAGRRDYAVLMLLARLGLRAGEAAAARVGDIDWRSGTILVRGKGGRDERLPLPSDVGAATADYCRNARPVVASRMLFLHARAPYGPISSSAVGHVVVRSCRRAGLPPASAHQLRHAAATAMRRAGAPLSEISQLLRHQHEGTTSRYGTIDPDELGPVTAPWPGEAA